ncbi:unannotated protein [freshwater metagenome]|uniref:Unannotated protein n=1 Tax=freshwater metagenome TaxID=449393 RepID=A0A6J7IKY2_9ZZZZ|nr:MCE family protein [Actinomycetota bacterium]
MLPQTQLLRRSVVVVVFALSCFGLLIFFWSAFGGPVPLRAQGYRFTVDFDEATMLAVQAEVRRSGVPVGRVVGLERTPSGLTRATIQLRSAYVPARADTRAMLRSKSLAGETYVELSSGTTTAAALPDGGRLGRGSVEPTAQLDDILGTFDRRTRAAFDTWIQQQAITLAGQGRGLNDTLAQLAPLEEQATALAALVRAQDPGLSTLVHDTGVVSSALSARGTQLRDLVTSANTVFGTTASWDRALAASVEALPAFQREARTTLSRLDRFSRETDPLVRSLQPAARELSPTLEATADLAPQLASLTKGLGPLYESGSTGLPATSTFLTDLTPLARELPSTLTQLNPVVGYAGNFRNEITAFVGNFVAVTEASGRGSLGDINRHYLRGLEVFGPDQLADYQVRPPSSRNAPYAKPGLMISQSRGLPTYATSQCDSRSWPTALYGPGVPAKDVTLIRERFGTVPVAPTCRPAELFDGKSFPQLIPGAVPDLP